MFYSMKEQLCIFKIAGILQDSNNVETTIKLRNPTKSLLIKSEIILLLKIHVYHQYQRLVIHFFRWK